MVDVPIFRNRKGILFREQYRKRLALRNHTLVHLRDLQTHPAGEHGFISDAGRMRISPEKISSGT